MNLKSLYIRRKELKQQIHCVDMSSPDGPAKRRRLELTLSTTNCVIVTRLDRLEKRLFHTTHAGV